MQVTATQRGYFDGRIIEPGEAFEVDEKAFSDKWMKKPDAPKRGRPPSGD